MSNAAFWVRADASAGLVVTGGSFVARWRDVRDAHVPERNVRRQLKQEDAQKRNVTFMIRLTE